MSETDVIEVSREAILAMIFISGPLMAVCLVIGLVISIFQAVTQIQEATLTFVPKMLAVFAATLWLMPFMLAHLSTFTHAMFDRIVALGGPG